jgi:hypothetical protein
MAIGDHLFYNGRLYILRGIDPMSVTDRRAQLEDAETGESLNVPLSEVEDAAGEGPSEDVSRKKG